ncbi:MAG: ATP-binding protein [Planctomycetales bacterium]|nr:ATP-binding protein [Planctomycetales bacterium]
MLPDYEKLGAFYLGRHHDSQAGQTTEQTLLYDSKDLCTHAVVVGMTGSGKTGLCLDLIEEAAIDGIPTIAIDPKGDIGNLLLTFPNLAPEDFRPWIDEGVARREGLAPEAYAEKIAGVWKNGLAKWGQTPDRIQRLRDAVEMRIYTPASSAGYPLTILRSLDAPSPEAREDQELLRERIASTASGLLALLDIDADPINSREHILVSNLLQAAWSQGQSLSLADLFRGIRTPGFDRVGIMDLESFYSEKDRMELALRLNNLMASPSFAGWLEGEPLNVHRLLYTPAGKPRIAIISIAHLSDKERMFLVTLLLNEILSWVRTQPGTSSLRALLYMDEVFGFFPPTATPPSKRPMLTLLKQARAYGLGVVLATQNPVDLDYKGLSNTGTWFIGRLQTERDKARVMEGLEGASTKAGSFDRGKMEATLAGLGSRVFLMNNVHDDVPVTFETRWAMSYLRGPLTRDQIKQLKQADDPAAGVDPATGASPEAAPRPTPAVVATPDEVVPTTTAAVVSTVAATAPPIAGSLFSGPSWNSLRPVNASQSSSTPVPAAGGGETRQAEQVLGIDSGTFIPPSIPQRFIEPVRPPAPNQRLVYRPGLLAVAGMHYVKSTLAVDLWHKRVLWWDTESCEGPEWERAQELNADRMRLFESMPPGASQAEVPAQLIHEKKFASYGKAIKDHAYRSLPLVLFRHAETKQVSRAGETESEFRVRITGTLNEQRDLEVDKLKQAYAAKYSSLDERVKKAQAKVDEERAQFSSKSMESALSLGTSLLGAMFGNKKLSVTNVRSAGSALKSVGRAASERTDIKQAEAQVEALREERDQLEQSFKDESATIEAKLDPTQIVLETIELPPRKSDISIDELYLVWSPYSVDASGIATCLIELPESRA